MTKFWIGALFLIALDLVSKWMAIEWIPPFAGGGYPFGGIPVFANFGGISFSLNYTVNTGAAWGMFHGYPGLLFGLRVLSLIAISFYMKNQLKTPLQKGAFMLVLAGGIGNVIDYGLYGHVIDFFHFVLWGYSFPIFNCADTYITVGVILLMATFWLQKKRQCA